MGSPVARRRRLLAHLLVGSHLLLMCRLSVFPSVVFFRLPFGISTRGCAMFTKTRWLHALPVTLFLMSTATGQPTRKFSEPRKVTLGTGVVLHYVERGKGDPIIFIHGGTKDYREWESCLADLTGDYRVIAYSRRYNYPNDNKPEKNYTPVVDAEDLAGLLKGLNVGKVHVVGNSWGGYVALLFALKHSDRVRTLTLSEPPVNCWLTDLPGERAKEGKAAFQFWTEQQRLAQEALRAGNKEKAFSYLPFGLNPDAPEARRMQVMDNAREIEALIVTEVRYPPVDREAVKGLKVPVLLLAGEKTKQSANSIWLVMEELTRLIPEGQRKLSIIPGTGHQLWQDRPKEGSQALLEFLSGK